MRKKYTLSAALILTAALLSACSDNNTPYLSEPVTTSAVTAAVTTTAAATAAVTAAEPSTEAVSGPAAEEPSHLNSPEDIGLHCTDESKKIYVFTYAELDFTAVYSPDNWHITDSYLIESYEDIVTICRALIEVHPIHSADMTSYRTADDMAYEWHQHNIAYSLLPDGSDWKESAKDVDLDAKDQNKNLFDFLIDRLDTDIRQQNRSSN